jgi:3-methyl-2-oxobutanoate hydroxymethyltransferase
MAETIRYLADRGIPVMSHIGLTPQASNTIGSFQPRGRFRSEWAAFEEDARAIAEAGAFAVVLEAMAELLAARITKQISIPTIGIGASAECDGQILVLEDMLGLSPRVPKFVKEYAQLGAAIEAAVKAFSSEVRTRAFPSDAYTYPMCEEAGEATKKTKLTGS